MTNRKARLMQPQTQTPKKEEDVVKAIEDCLREAREVKDP